MYSELHSILNPYCSIINESGLNMRNKCKLTLYSLAFLLLFPALFLIFTTFFMIYLLCGFFCGYLIVTIDQCGRNPCLSFCLTLFCPILIPLGLGLIFALGVLFISLSIIPIWFLCFYAFFRMQWHWRSSTAQERQFDPNAPELKL